jgi:hypothetical protein
MHLIVVAMMLGSTLCISRRMGLRSMSKMTQIAPPTGAVLPTRDWGGFDNTRKAQRGQHRLYGGGSGLYNVQGDVERRVYGGCWRWCMEWVSVRGVVPY